MRNKDLQPAINVLLELHEKPKKLKEIVMLGGLQHENVAQSAIAGIVRLLMKEVEKIK